MINSKSAGGVVQNSDNKVLVVSQHGTSWSLPKGHIENNENTLEAAHREIYEESGIKQLEFVKELGNYQRYKIDIDGGEDKSELKHIFMYHFLTNEQLLDPKDKENPEARWVDKNKVADLLTAKNDKNFYLSIVNLLN